MSLLKCLQTNTAQYVLTITTSALLDTTGYDGTTPITLGDLQSAVASSGTVLIQLTNTMRNCSMVARAAPHNVQQYYG